jgi:hypothetical protein
MNNTNFDKLRQKLEELAREADQEAEEWATYGDLRHTAIANGKAEAFREVIELLDTGEFN